MIQVLLALISESGESFIISTSSFPVISNKVLDAHTALPIITYPVPSLPTRNLLLPHTGAVGIAAVHKVHWLPTSQHHCTKHVR